MSPDELAPRRPDRPVGASALAGWGAVSGLATAVPVGALTRYQVMVEGGGIPELGAWGQFLLYAAAAGAVIGAVVGYRPHGVAGAASGGVLIGLLGWLLIGLTVVPALRGEIPNWSAPTAAGAYRELVADLLHGGLTGVLLHGLLSRRATRPRSAPEPARELSRVVIVGGGFGGVSAARRFERLALRGAALDVTVVSDSNFLLFTPMLAEVASSAVEPAHISAPIRAAAAHTRFRHASVEHVDTDGHAVRVAAGAAPAEWIPYDHLVLAVGSVPYFLDLPGVEEHARTLKDLSDATLLRNQVLELLERADHLEPDPRERERLLTFVVAGGGFAGTETIAELFDLVHGVLHYFPGIAPHEPRFVLVHSRDRILPELSPELGEYAVARLRARGIEFRLGDRIAQASSAEVVLTGGERIPTRTFVWTAGNRPGPLVAGLGGEHGRTGALVTDSTFRVAGLPDVWAIGDCAQVPDGDGNPFPPTAQHALRQGSVVADNIAAVLAGRRPTPFRFRAIGVLVALGHRTAVAEIRGLRFSGLAAWVLWRGIYLAKLPGIEKRARVLVDWSLDLVFPRDIVVTTAAQKPIAQAPVAQAPVAQAPAQSVPSGRER